MNKPNRNWKSKTENDQWPFSENRKFSLPELYEISVTKVFGRKFKLVRTSKKLQPHRNFDTTCVQSPSVKQEVRKGKI